MTTVQVGSNDRQLVLVVEGTAALGPYWPLLRSEYIDKILRVFSGNEMSEQKPTGANVDMALVVFRSRGPHSECWLQRSGWTSNLDVFLQWLSAINFCGGGLGDAATAEGLADALLMCSSSQATTQMSQTIQKHCVLVAASNPYPLLTSVPRPPGHSITTQITNAETQQWLADAETVAKAFAQCLVSLSVIAPKQLPTLRSIYNAGKRNPSATDAVMDNVKHSHHLVLLSDSFVDARSALSCSGTSLTPNSNMVKSELASTATHSVSAQPPTASVRSSSGQTVNGMMVGHQPTSNRVFPAAVKMEVPSSVSLTSGPGLSHVTSPSLFHSTSQAVPGQFSSSSGLSNQEIKPNVEAADGQDFKTFVNNTSQQLRTVTAPATNVSLLNNLSQARQVMSSATLPGASTLGLQTTGNTPPGMHVSNMLASGMGSAAISTAQTVLATGQSGLTSTATSVGLVGIGQVAPNVAQSTFATGTNIVGNSSLGVPQVGSSVSASITGAQGVVGLGQSVPGMGHGGMATGSQLGQGLATGSQLGQGLTTGSQLGQGLATGSQLGQGGVGVNQNVLSGIGPVGVSSAAGTMVPKSSLPQSIQIGLPGIGAGNSASGNLQLPPTATVSQQPAATQAKYTKVWEGLLGGSRQGRPVPICRLEGYRNISSSDTIAADWPSSMQIIRLISQDHITSKHYQGKADFLIFRPMNTHGFLLQLAEKKLSAVIQLPTQTLLLSTSDKPGRMIGMLFPGDAVVFKPQLPSQPHLQQQQQQQQQQQPQGMASAMGQAFAQGQLSNQTRPQLMSQGQFQGQGPASMPGAGYLS